MELSLFSWLLPRRGAGVRTAPVVVASVPEHSTRCAICGQTICPGDHVALHLWKSNEPPPGYATIYIAQPPQVVVCKGCEVPQELVLKWEPLQDGKPRIVYVSGWREAGPIEYGFSRI